MSVLSVNDSSVKKDNHIHYVHDCILCLNFIFTGKYSYKFFVYFIYVWFYKFSAVALCINKFDTIVVVLIQNEGSINC